jgi:DNA-binding SARP family transcriptional activator
LKRLRAAPPPPLEISGFGRLRVSRRGAVIPERAWRRQRSLELLGLLLLAGPAGRIRDELIVHLWPDASSESGVEQFHTHLHALRAALEPESARGTSRYVLADGRTYRLDFSLIAFWDAGFFEASFARGEYADAAALYRGKLFDGLTPEDEWLELARNRYREMALQAHTRLARAFQEVGDVAGARQSWAAVVDLDPYREDAYRGLMRALLSLGHKDEALAHYRRCAEVLRRELDTEPSPETVALYRSIVAT